MNRMIAGVLLMTMTGCATVPPADAQETPVRGGGQCDASKAQGLVGKARSSKLGADALRLTGAATLRWIKPGTMVTMDYREDRLNLHLDAHGQVTKVNCG
jgi:Peptidase inhibitor I78 family